MSAGSVLSPEQIAALVASAQEGTAPAAAEPAHPRRPRRVREIDFTRPSKFSQEQQRRVERAHEGFCRSASTQLSAELRSQLELEVINVQQATWSAALAEIPQPSLFGIVRTRPLDTALLLCGELELVHQIISRLLGGAGAGKHASRTLTEIELSLARRLYAALLSNLSHTWQELLGLALELESFEMQPQGVQLLMPTSEPCLVVVIEAREAGGTWTLSIVAPYRSIQAVLDRIPTTHGHTEGEGERLPEDAAAVQVSVAGVPTQVRAEVAALDLTVEEVLAISEGDVLRFGVPASLGMTLYADEVPVHRVAPGRSGTRRAVRVLERLEVEP